MKTIQGDVNLTQFQLKEIPEILNGVHIKDGGFYIPYNRITSLKNSPEKVDRIFNCNANKINNFVGGPKEVGHLLAISCRLTTLEGFPKITGYESNILTGRIDISHNNLTSLVGLPETLYGNLDISNNPLKSLQGCSKVIKGNFVLDSIPITNMIGGPEIIEGDCTLISTQINSFVGFPKHIHGNLFIGDTPLWTELRNKTGSKIKTKHLIWDLLKSIKCKVDGYIWNNDEDYDDEDYDDEDYDDDDDGDRNEFGVLRRPVW